MPWIWRFGFGMEARAWKEVRGKEIKEFEEVLKVRSDGNRLIYFWKENP